MVCGDIITTDYYNTPKKKGKFRVLRLGKGEHVNKYICGFVTGKKTIVDNTEYNFDVGYVQRKLFRHFFPIT